MPSQTEKRDYKSEYRYGEILPMKGSTTNHNQIAGNIYAFLKFAVRGQNYGVFINDIRLWIPRYNLYTYPDVMVIQGERLNGGNPRTALLSATHCLVHLWLIILFFGMNARSLITNNRRELKISTLPTTSQP
ncbi:MAG: Uma2 family endonuclease [Microcoleus sp. SIO2G3]|nr:Uma2 family endonuclease [Microcoleus sp. SIO2G3]